MANRRPFKRRKPKLDYRKLFVIETPADILIGGSDITPDKTQV